MDVSSAFLKSEPLGSYIYVVRPLFTENGAIGRCELLQTLYGLSTSRKARYLSLIEFTFGGIAGKSPP